MQPKYSRREVLGAGAALASGLLGVGGTSACAGRGDAPNVLLIVADDLGVEGLSCYGSTSYRTPHLDELAAGGLRATHCYATPLCTPSRVQLMTGLYPFRTGWSGGMWQKKREKMFLDPELPNFANLLQGAGYATAIAGKWQLSLFDDRPDHPTACGFRESCLWSWYDDPEAQTKSSRYWKPDVWRNGAPDPDVAREDVFGPDVFTDFLVDFMRRHRERPFLAFYSMALPHKPFVPTPSSIAKGAKKRGGDSEKSARIHFPAMIAYLDALIGRLVGTLDELGLRDSTLILFTTDNGTAQKVVSRMGSLRVRGGKNQMTEQGTHVPLIANWPGRTPAGQVVEDLIDLSDFLPTLAEVCGVPLPPDAALDGRSFAGELLGRPGEPRDWVFVQLRKHHYVRDRRWRLHEDGRLYDMGDRLLDPMKAIHANGTPESEAARRRLGRVLAHLLDAPESAPSPPT